LNPIESSRGGVPVIEGQGTAGSPKNRLPRHIEPTIVEDQGGTAREHLIVKSLGKSDIASADDIVPLAAEKVDAVSNVMF
jgi:hypothetical protein